MPIAALFRAGSAVSQSAFGRRHSGSPAEETARPMPVTSRAPASSENLGAEYILHFDLAGPHCVGRRPFPPPPSCSCRRRGRLTLPSCRCLPPLRPSRGDRVEARIADAAAPRSVVPSGLSMTAACSSTAPAPPPQHLIERLVGMGFALPAFPLLLMIIVAPLIACYCSEPHRLRARQHSTMFMADSPTSKRPWRSGLPPIARGTRSFTSRSCFRAAVLVSCWSPFWCTAGGAPLVL